MSYQKMKRGWYGQPRRHRTAALKGWQKRKKTPVDTALDIGDFGRRIPNNLAETYFKVLSLQRQNHVATAIRGRDGQPIDIKTAHNINEDFRQRMTDAGIRFDSDWQDNYRKWRASQFRLINRQSTNIRTGRKGRYLTWKDWVYVNNTFNTVLDNYGVSANVQTLGGKFIVRRGKKSYQETDWEINKKDQQWR